MWVDIPYISPIEWTWDTSIKPSLPSFNGSTTRQACYQQLLLRPSSGSWSNHWWCGRGQGTSSTAGRVVTPVTHSQGHLTGVITPAVITGRGPSCRMKISWTLKFMIVWVGHKYLYYIYVQILYDLRICFDWMICKIQVNSKGDKTSLLLDKNTRSFCQVLYKYP